jgi:hypothetical protein
MDYEPYGIIFVKVCVGITDDMIMFLRDFGSYGIIFMTTSLPP